jgi:predicted GIY-YIG superfamily endonuclease
MLQLAEDPPRYYIGETDSMSQRLRQHRKKGTPWKYSKAVIFPVENKTEARYWESLLIQELAQAGFRLESLSDGRTKRHLRE